MRASLRRSRSSCCRSLSSPAGKAVPSCCVPVRMSCWFGSSPRPLTVVAVLVERRLLVDLVRLGVELVDARRDLHALGVRPWTRADAVAGVHRAVAAGAEIGAPGLAARAGRLGQRLAMRVGAFQSAEIGAVAGPALVTKKLISALAASCADALPTTPNAAIAAAPRRCRLVLILIRSSRKIMTGGIRMGAPPPTLMRRPPTSSHFTANCDPVIGFPRGAVFSSGAQGRQCVELERRRSPHANVLLALR